MSEKEALPGIAFRVLLQKGDRIGFSVHISFLILCGYQVDQANMAERVKYDVENKRRDYDR